MMKYQPFRRREAHSHTDDWLMTYADMITLLLCFFVIFLSVSIPKKLPQMVVSRVAVVQAAPPAVIPDIPDTQPPVVVPRPVPEQPPVIQGNLPFHNDIAEEEEAPVPAPISMQPLGYSTPADALPPPVEAQAAKPADIGGDRITIIEMNNAEFFAAGDAKLSAQGKRILLGVADKLRDAKYSGYQITVEGHTDDAPIHTAKFPSNWELSSSRAAAVVHDLLDLGLPAARLRAVGYADTQPKAPNRDGQGHAIPANQAQNRRVVITLERIVKG